MSEEKPRATTKRRIFLLGVRLSVLLCLGGTVAVAVIGTHEARAIADHYREKVLERLTIVRTVVKHTGTEDVVLLAKAVILHESGGDHRAVSPVGARGLMQLMPETGRAMYRKLGLQGRFDLHDPKQNAVLGVAYLQEMLDRYQDLRLALAAYNAGPGKVDEWILRYKTRDWTVIADRLTKLRQYRETVNYVKNVEGYFRESQRAERYVSNAVAMIYQTDSRG